MQAALGMPPYPRKFSDLRAVAFWWSNQWGFATYNPNIKTSQDLKGKTIAVRPKGGPWDLFYEFVLKYCWGIQDSVRLAPTAPSDFSEAMLTGTAAAAHWGSREVAQGVFLLDAGQSEMRLKRKTYFIPISKAEFERGVKNSGNPLSFGWMEVPPGAYGPGDPQGAVGMVYYAPGPASWDMIDPEAVYEYVKAINDNRDKYAEYSPAWKGAIGGPKMSPLRLLGEQWVASGALKYYKERGWTK